MELEVADAVEGTMLIAAILAVLNVPPGGVADANCVCDGVRSFTS